MERLQRSNKEESIDKEEEIGEGFYDDQTGEYWDTPPTSTFKRPKVIRRVKKKKID